MTSTPFSPERQAALLKSAVSKNVWRLVPLLVLGYFFNYIDRTSVSFAALQMNKDIGLTEAQFGFGAGIMFASYCLLEVPSNMALYRVGARRWMARIMITWGLAAAATAFAVGPHSFYAIRFMLGVFEAGFFPGVIYFLSDWFPARTRTAVLGWFMCGTPLSSVVGGPVSSALLGLNGWMGLKGWQWLFVLEGLPACLLGVLCLWVLADKPAKAKWLSEDERMALAAALAAEKGERPRTSLLAALKDVRVLILCGITFAFTMSSYGVGLWLPLILKTHKLSTMAIGYMSAIPYVFTAVGMMVWAWQADRDGRKFTHLFAALALGCGGFVLSVYAENSLPLALLAITLALISVNSARSVFYTIPQAFLSGPALASGLAFINAVGASGGFFGPYMVGWLKQATGSFNAGMIGLAVVLGLAMVLTALLAAAAKRARV